MPLVKIVQTLVGTAYLRLRSVRCQGWVRVVGHRPLIHGGRRISIGARSLLGGPMFPVQLVARGQGRIALGARSFVNQGTTITSVVGVTIGADVNIGDLCAIFDTNFHPLTPSGDVKSAPVFIGDGVWLARMVTVLPGAEIGRGSVISAGSVVRGVIPEDCIAAGNPAAVIRQLTS